MEKEYSSFCHKKIVWKKIEAEKVDKRKIKLKPRISPKHLVGQKMRKALKTTENK